MARNDACENLNVDSLSKEDQDVHIALPSPISHCGEDRAAESYSISYDTYQRDILDRPTACIEKAG